MPLPYRDRADAGRALAADLLAFAGRPNVLVLALPRGGVPVAFEIARLLRAPLDVFVVRKLGVPGHEELAMGAIATGDIVVLNREVLSMLRISREDLDAAIGRERLELARRDREYRDSRPPPQIGDRLVILVDDGLATGSTMLAAVRALREEHPQRIIVAVPVASREAVALLRSEGVEVVCPATPEPFYGVGWWYQDFSQTTDAEVREQLAQQAGQAEAPKQPPQPFG
jgi:predicted phosphoribosyltransferase